VPWLSLQPGDVVNIYYRSTPYATKLGIQAVGTAAKPIVINGVTDANCNRPVITGANAVESTDSIAAGYWSTSAGSIVEGYGVIVFLWGPSQAYATAQSYITVQNLEITGGLSSNTYTNHSGAVVNYTGASGIYAVAVNHLTVENDLITGNNEGVFVNSQDNERTSYYVTLRRNIIFGNGLAGSYLFHNVYVQGVRSLYEGNYIGQVISTSDGSSLKDRSSGTVIRDNYVVSSARALDLVDTQESPGNDNPVYNDPLYDYAWVYGNVIVDDFSTPVASYDLIHWGGDSGSQAFSTYRNGTLYFYFNTVVVENESNGGQQIGIFDMPTNSQTLEARSNIFWFTNLAAGDQVGLGLCAGTINLDDRNWLSSSAVLGTAQNAGDCNNSAPTVTEHTNGTLVQGASPLLNSDFTLSTSSGSPVIGQGVLAPTTVPSTAATVSNLQPTAEFAAQSSTVTPTEGQPTLVPRATVTDLGAYAAD
jgi:hypothetical protein